MLTELAECMCEDNQGAISLAKNPVAHARMKHIDIRYHYIREAIESGTIDVQYCPTREMNADSIERAISELSSSTWNGHFTNCSISQLSGSVEDSNCKIM